MASRIGKTGWLALYIFAGATDILQYLVIPTIFGIGVSEAADPFIGAFLAINFQLRGVSMIKHPNRLLSLVGVVALEELTGGFAPAWIFDIWYIHRTVRSEEAQEMALKQQEEALANNVRSPLYDTNGNRAPRMNQPTEPHYVGGIRKPEQMEPDFV